MSGFCVCCLQIVESVQRLESIERMFQMMNSREDISTFVQANNPGTYTSPVKNFNKPEESQSLVSAKKCLSNVVEDLMEDPCGLHPAANSHPHRRYLTTEFFSQRHYRVIGCPRKFDVQIPEGTCYT